MADIANLVRYTWRFGVFFATNLYGFFGYVMWTLVLSPLRVLWPSLYWKTESRLFRALQSFVILWIDSGGYGVVESGDEVGRLSEQEVLLLANHQSTADVPLVMLALWNKGSVMANSYWIMDWIFHFTNFGIMSSIRRDVFIKQGKETRDQQFVMLKQHLLDCYLPQGRKWIVLFPEGGFLRNRMEVSQRYARKNGYPLLHNVSLPRVGAMKTILDTVGASSHDNSKDSDTVTNGNCNLRLEDRRVRWVVDMTIAYSNDEGAPPDMFGMCVGYRQRQDMHVHYRAYPLSKVPRDGDGMTKWLYNLYEEKEDLMEYFKSHGCFPADSAGAAALPSKPAQVITYDWVHVVLIQGFYMASAYVHYAFVLKPLWSLVFG
ncbi:acyl-CoA:lysophosphatidylglycerol acyltransferase 1-like [Babylonia areolata]|uniref:acyl-CoA:lysophosphatidylglycerol acyltransferase 1-like n=1 Tax=Babylonia areolata TaxID=304850 RepID=UPI003FD1D4F3